MDYKSKYLTRVSGKMSTRGADLVGRLMAVAVLVVAVGLAVLLVLYGVSLVRWW